MLSDINLYAQEEVPARVARAVLFTPLFGGVFHHHHGGVFLSARLCQHAKLSVPAHSRHVDFSSDGLRGARLLVTSESCLFWHSLSRDLPLSVYHRLSVQRIPRAGHNPRPLLKEDYSYTLQEVRIAPSFGVSFETPRARTLVRRSPLRKVMLHQPVVSIFSRRRLVEKSVFCPRCDV